MNQTIQNPTINQDYVVVKGVNSDGFGTVPKMIMRDERLSIGAKAVYAYFCSYAGAGKSAFPQRKRVLKELNISYNSFRKYRTELEECGYITVIARTRPNGSTSSNLYVLNPEVAQPEQVEKSIENKDPLSNFEHSEGAENTITPVHDRVSNFEPLPNFETVSNFEQGGVSNFDLGGVSNFDPPYTSNNKTNNKKKNQPTNQPTNTIGISEPPAELDGWMDDVEVEEAMSVYHQICSLSQNKHLISQSFEPYKALLAEHYTPQEILRAWKATVKDKVDLEARYQPQLKAWLEGTRDDNAKSRIGKSRRTSAQKQQSNRSPIDDESSLIDSLRHSDPEFESLYCNLTTLQASLMTAIIARSKESTDGTSKQVEEIKAQIEPLQQQYDSYLQTAKKG